jgi:signal transduction histidine kinase
LKKITNKLEFNVWLYLIIFSIIIMGLVWVFQVLSIKDYYELSTRSEMKNVLEQVKKNYDAQEYETMFNTISNDTGICIEIYDYNSRDYSSIGCRVKAMEFFKEKREFIEGNESNKDYEIIDKMFGGKQLLYALRLNDGKVAFVQSSLVPIDSTVNILRNQLIIITIIVITLSLLVAIFISKKISKPIEEINNNAKRLAKGEYGNKIDINTNIDEIKELNDTLNQTSVELAKTEGLRRELFANVSHDLKTPLTMIKAYAEMIRDLHGDNKKKREENLNVIIEETDRLNLLVNDVLDLSKYNAGTIKLEKEEFDLDELIKEILNRYHIYTEKDGYIIDYKSDGETIINADKARISQVVYNLINNALNYTGDNKKVTVKLKKGKVEVIDTGKGIKEEDIDLIWDKYYKADKTYSRMQIGSGIGLSIVKNILELHDFKYGVDSKLGHGTTFYFYTK